MNPLPDYASKTPPAADAVARDCQSAGLAFALPLAGAAIVRVALEPAYFNLRFTAWLVFLALFVAAQRRLLANPTRSRLRWTLVLHFAALNAGYAMIGLAMNSAAGWRADGLLYGTELKLFGGDPQAWFEPLHSAWVSTAAILGYISMVGFLVYLCAEGSSQLDASAGRRQRGLLGMYGVGFAGYFLLPAAGPLFHLSGQYRVIPQTAFSGYFYDWVVRCCSHVDVFPSLHAAVAAYAVTWAVARNPRHLRFLLVPAIGLVFGALYFRFHYGVDVLAGLLLGAGFAEYFARVPAPAVHPADPMIVASSPVRGSSARRPAL